MFASSGSRSLQCPQRLAKVLANCVFFCLATSLLAAPWAERAEAAALFGASAGVDSGNSTPFLLLPASVAYDGTGDLFFADARRHQIFELTLAGVWSVVAGTGEQGFAGDGGAATTAMLNGPHGLAVASDGTLYIADTGNQRVRSVHNGIISTLAGSGVRGYSGDGPVLKAAFRDPTGLALQPDGSLIVCDSGNQRVRRISGTAIVTIAGNGIQGFAGDGGDATGAELDTPTGAAVTASGAILIADTHNQRIRSLTADGRISTLAGTGQKGFTGDGGAALKAALDLPFGVAVGADGTVMIADAGNQRIRSVSPLGIITTLIGTGVQGGVDQGTPGAQAVLDSPRAVGTQLQGHPVFAEGGNRLVQELANDNALYTLALLTSPRASSTTLSTNGSIVYGTGTANVIVAGSAATPEGGVVLSDSGTSIGVSTLAGGRAAFDLGQLSAGTHVLAAMYSGDGLHASSFSIAGGVTIKPAPTLATASAATAVYGSPLPALGGSLAGILPQDVTNVRPVFVSGAKLLSPAGTYPITATLSGPGSENYTVSMSAGSGSLTISQAGSAVVLAPLAQTYAGLPILLSANVSPVTSGAPGGSVEFFDGVSLLGSSFLAGTMASASVPASTEGIHHFAARYSGDANFLPSQSAVTDVTVAAMPDFELSLGVASQSVQGGSTAIFTINLVPQNGPFTGAVVLDVRGLPSGAVASFSPAASVPGSAGTSVTLSIQTVARIGMLPELRKQPVAAAFLLLLGLWFLPVSISRRDRIRLLSVLVVLLVPLSGCGTRTTGSALSGGQTSSLLIRGTGTNLAGVAVTHSVTATLTVF